MPVHVFHKNELWMESPVWIPTAKLPPQSYIRRNMGTGPVWYMTQRFGAMDNALPINASDVPDWVRTCCLLLNLQV